MGTHISKEQWVSLFQEAGLDDATMMKWHKLFESHHAEAHAEFLLWLGLSQEEIATIRLHSR